MSNQGIILVNWPEGVNFPIDANGQPQKKGISSLTKTQRRRVVRQIQDDTNPMSFVKLTSDDEGDTTQKRLGKPSSCAAGQRKLTIHALFHAAELLVGQKRPVIVGAPPSPRSTHERGRRLFHNGAWDCRGPRRPQSPAATNGEADKGNAVEDNGLKDSDGEADTEDQSDEPDGGKSNTKGSRRANTRHSPSGLASDARHRRYVPKEDPPKRQRSKTPTQVASTRQDSRPHKKTKRVKAVVASDHEDLDSNKGLPDRFFCAEHRLILFVVHRRLLLHRAQSYSVQ